MELIAYTHNLLLHNAQRAEQKAIKYNLYCSNLAFKNWQLKFTIKKYARMHGCLVWKVFLLPFASD